MRAAFGSLSFARIEITRTENPALHNRKRLACRVVDSPGLKKKKKKNLIGTTPLLSFFINATFFTLFLFQFLFYA